MTSDISVPAPPPPDAAGERTSPWQRIAGVLFSPDETFREIALRPDVLLPLVLTLILALVSGIVLAPRLQYDSMKETMARANPNMSVDDINRAVKMAGAVGKVSAYASPVFILIIFALVAGVLLLAFRLFGGEGTFKQAFSVTVYAWIPRVIQTIILTGVVLAKGSMDVNDVATIVRSNPAFLVDMTEHPVLFSFLATFDVFTLWSVALLIIGFAYVSRFSKARSATIIISLWAFVTFIKLGFAALGASKMKAAS